jgi:hypothetical protein
MSLTTYNSIKTIRITANTAEIIVERSEKPTVSVELINNNETTEVYQKNSTLFIKEESNNSITIGGDLHIGNIVQSSSGSVFSNINIGGVRGGVVINGKKITLDDLDKYPDADESNKPPKIIIKAPADLSYVIDISGVSSIDTKVSINDLNVSLSGTSKAAILSCISMDAELNGTSVMEAVIKEGECYIDTSGTSSAKITISSAVTYMRTLSAGTSNITTTGLVTGNYKAVASGCASITHIGQVNGSIKERTSGSGKVNIG